MKQYFESMKNQLGDQFGQSSVTFLRTGLELFHKHRNFNPNVQVAIGNLGIAVELMLKAFIVKKNPALVFRGLPLELQVLFACPDAIPQGFNCRPHDIDLRSFNYKTINLEESISVFYLLFPNHKHALHPHLRFLSLCRNLSVHAALPSFQTYEMERTAYIALRIFEILNAQKTFGYTPYLPTKEQDVMFLSSFQQDRIDRVRKKIEAAKEKSKTLNPSQTDAVVDDWDSFATDCPICGSAGILTGYSDIRGEGEEDGSVSPHIYFYADSFKCGECGLILDDLEELQLAGMEAEYDRDEEIDQWFADYEPDWREY